MSQGSHRNGSADGEDAAAAVAAAAAAAEANGEGISNGGLLGDGDGGVGFLSIGSVFNLLVSGPGDTVMLSAVSSSLWKHDVSQ